VGRRGVTRVTEPGEAKHEGLRAMNDGKAWQGLELDVFGER